MTHWIRFQIFLVSIMLFGIFSILYTAAERSNRRWDLTEGKLYSLSEPTVKLLETLSGSRIDVTAFYPHDDPARPNFEIFLRECQTRHPDFHYRFYDPDRVPKKAREYQVADYYTVVVQYEGRTDKVVGPTEQALANALLKVSSSEHFGICFASGHGEADLQIEDRRGLAVFRQGLEKMSYTAHEMILLRDKIPPFCNAVAVAGPIRDYDAEELGLLKQAFQSGRGILFLIDPMDPGMGKPFIAFLKEFGILAGEDVLVDKANRLVGGDFLVPKITKYNPSHPVSSTLKRPSIFPVARTMQLTQEVPPGMTEPIPFAVTGQGSWAERNFEALEKGNAEFDPALGDLAGPLPLAVVVEADLKNKTEKQRPGRLAALGDSDFLTNAYIGFPGNGDLALNLVQWLAGDDRFISIHPRDPEFKPLYLTGRQRTAFLTLTLVGIPVSFFMMGSLMVLSRRR